MSNIPSQSTSRSKFDAIFNAALRSYKKKTGNDITSHPIATELQSCNSSDAVLAILRRQISMPDQSQNSDEELANCLIPTVNVLYTLSNTLGEAVGLVIITMSSLWNICALTFSLRSSHHRKLYLLALVFSSWFAILYFVVQHILTCGVFRWSKTSMQAKGLSSSCSAGSNTSSVGSRFTSGFRLPLL